METRDDGEAGRGEAHAVRGRVRPGEPRSAGQWARQYAEFLAVYNAQVAADGTALEEWRAF